MNHNYIWGKDEGGNYKCIAKDGRLWLTGTPDPIEAIKFVFDYRARHRYETKA